ncbi:MAG: DUF2996 domain-containing protein [Cyanobacteriota bacterium]|nr:DUF2996 domain-containing protein [Cyanobacteriota bacterium]
MPSDANLTPEAELTPKASTKAKKPKEEKPEKPFSQMIQEDLIPVAQAAFAKRGVTDLQLTLDGQTLVGSFGQGRRSFTILFAEQSLSGAKFFSCSSDGVEVSTVESFMIDERKVDVPLAVFYIVQRLYAQQWF